jgi:DNA-binding Lrp family transcriptional regulator
MKRDLPYRLDDIDRRILRELQRDGRLTNAELADRVGLSPSPCLRRVRLLEEANVISGYSARLNASRLDLGFTVFARVWLKQQDAQTVENFTKEAARLPNVLDCFLMAGDCDFILRVVAKDLDDYRQFQIQHLTRIEGVANVKTEIPMEIVKENGNLPI